VALVLKLRSSRWVFSIYRHNRSFTVPRLTRPASTPNSTTILINRLSASEHAILHNISDINDSCYWRPIRDSATMPCVPLPAPKAAFDQPLVELANNVLQYLSNLYHFLALRHAYRFYYALRSLNSCCSWLKIEAYPRAHDEVLGILLEIISVSQ
jgi:hypothetical protein